MTKHISLLALVASTACAPSAEGPNPDGPTSSVDGEATVDAGPGFTATSYWNTPLDTSGPAPVHPNSAAFLSALKTDNCKNEKGCGGSEVDYLKLANSDGYGAAIWYASASDPKQTVTCGGANLSIRIPAGAKPQTGSDGAIVIYDSSDNVVAGLHKVKMSGGKITSCDGFDQWHLDSNGLAHDVAGGSDAFNKGHRGLPSPTRGVTKAEADAGAVDHRLECFLYATGGQSSPIWPMDGFESGRGGSIPEGVVMRIKASVSLAGFKLPAEALAIAESLQKYGCIVGDNSGSSTMLKLQAYEKWNITADALAPIKWDNWEFVKAGYDPTTGATH